MNYLSNNLVEEALQYVEVVNLDEASQMLQQGINIIDVRESEEYSKGAIPGAINIPRSILEFVVGEHLDKEDLNKPHIIYCRTGGRAALAAITMMEMGYLNVMAMQEGFSHWEKEGRQVMSSSQTGVSI